jgi:hypothetical protein
MGMQKIDEDDIEEDDDGKPGRRRKTEEGWANPRLDEEGRGLR